MRPGLYELPAALRSIKNPPARVVFICGHAFGAEAFQGVLRSDACRAQRLSVVLALCLHPRHALSVVGYTDLHGIAVANGVPAISFDSVSSDGVLQQLKNTPHDYLFGVGLSQLLPKEVLDLPMRFNGGNHRHELGHGCIGMHPTILPTGRGRAPIPWSIIKGVRDSGVTGFLLEEGADAGNVVAVEQFKIAADDDAGDVFEKVGKSYCKLAERIAPMLAQRKLKSRPQSGQVTNWERRRPRDGWLDFSESTMTLLTLVRASAFPYPGAFFVIGDRIVVVDHAIPVEPKISASPGTVVGVTKSGAVTISTRDGALRMVPRAQSSRAKCRIGERALTSLDKSVG